MRDSTHSLVRNDPAASCFPQARISPLVGDIRRECCTRRRLWYPAPNVGFALHFHGRPLPRIYKTVILQYNGTFLSLPSLSLFLDQLTARRFLERTGPWSVRQLVGLHHRLGTQLVFPRGSRNTLTLRSRFCRRDRIRCNWRVWVTTPKSVPMSFPRTHLASKRVGNGSGTAFCCPAMSWPTTGGAPCLAW
jgi:hypothetical protein